MEQPRFWQRSEVAERILAGETLVIYRSFLLRITSSWLAEHPGGALSILHYVGRDATDEIDAFHAEHTLRRVKGFIVGRVEVGENGWEPLIPPVASGWIRKATDAGEKWTHLAQEKRASDKSPYVDSRLTLTEHNHASSAILLVEKANDGQNINDAPSMSTITPPPSTLSPAIQTRHARAYRQLHDRVTAAGLYETPFITGYGPEVLRYFLFGAISYLTYQRSWFMTSALFLGMLWHQLTFTVHDLGHMGVTHDWFWDRIIAIGLADFIGGLSVGWWVDNHNIHHLVTNHPTHDPDIQHIPFFAISPVFLTSLYSSYYNRVMTFDKASEIFIAFQHKLFYIVMALARFNLYANSYAFLWKQGVMRGKRGWPWWSEVFGTAVYWMWYLRAVRGCGSWKTGLAFVLISHVTASPLHVQIVLSHFSRSTADLGPVESFVDRQLRTTSDVICHPSVEFIHGGLHLQVTHHLFPRLPRHNLKAASFLVKEFAKEQGLEYAEFRFREGNNEVLGVLSGVADQVKIMSMVAREEVRHHVEDQKVGAK